MDTPKLALRFRDATPGVNTVEAHRVVLGREGAVWWGWWKKEFEPDCADWLRSAASGQFLVYLIDRSTEMAYLAEVLRIELDHTEVDAGRVPAYYWDRRGDVGAWFLLLSIKDAEYPVAIAEALGAQTLLDLSTSLRRKPAAHVREKARSDRHRVLHVSDLHFGNDHAFLSRRVTMGVGELRTHLSECVRGDLERIDAAKDIAAIIASGDFTTAGDWSDPTRQEILDEMRSLREALDLAAGDIIALPGNHDVVRYPEGESVDVAALSVANQTSYKHERDYRTFAEELTERSWRDPLNYFRVIELPVCDVVICALNSCTIAATEWTEYGYVGRSGLDVLNDVARLPIARPTFKILCLHHHLIPVTSVESPNSRGVSLTLDAVQVLAAAQAAGIHIVLHGHQHQSNIATFRRWPMAEERETRPLIIVSGGSTGARNERLPGAERNTYSVLTFFDGGIELVIRELRSDGKAGMQLFGGQLHIAPTMPV